MQKWGHGNILGGQWGWGRGWGRPGCEGLECPVDGPRPFHQAGGEVVRPVAWEDHPGTFEREDDQSRPRPRLFYTRASVTPIGRRKQSRKQNLPGLKGETDKLTDTLGDVNIPLSATDRTNRQKSQDRKPEECQPT